MPVPRRPLGAISINPAVSIAAIRQPGIAVQYAPHLLNASLNPTFRARRNWQANGLRLLRLAVAGLLPLWQLLPPRRPAALPLIPQPLLNTKNNKLLTCIAGRHTARTDRGARGEQVSGQ